MSKVLAIARLAVSNAIRSRVVVSLLFLLLLTVVGVPLTIKSDGTVAGLVRIQVTYALGVSSAILALATVWAGCAAVATEIEEKHAHLLVTKPVYLLQIWLGKWAGLLALNAILLGVTGVAVYAGLMWTTRPAALTPAERTRLREEVLVARRNLRPVAFNVDQAAREQLAALTAKGSPPLDVPPRQALEEIKKALQREFFTVPHPQRRSWVFDLPPREPGSESILLRFQFSTSDIGPTPVRGLWEVGPPDGPARFEVSREDMPRQPHTLRLPGSVSAGDRRLRVSYWNNHPDPVTVFFDPDGGLTLHPYASVFETNFIRSLLTILLQLAFLAAIGITAGSLFSTPVAVFAAFSAVLVLRSGAYVESLAHQAKLFGSGPGEEPAFWDMLLGGFFKLLYLVIRPLQDPSPLEWLGGGEWVPWALVGSMLLVKVILYGGALAVAGSWLLGRREVGMPT